MAVKPHLIGVRVDDQMREALELLAARQQVSVSDVVRHAVTAHCHNVTGATPGDGHGHTANA